MRSIKESLVKNKEIPKSSYFPMPDMKVYLDVPDEVRRIRFPRVFSHAIQPVLNHAVERGLRMM